MSYFIDVDNLKIHVVDRREECETALIFVHGRCLSERIWERQMQSPLLSGYRLIAIDLPGHGQSGGSNDPIHDYSLQGGIRVLKGVISKLHIRSFVLVGLSLGGHIVLQCCSRLPGCIGVFTMTMPITKPIQFDRMYSAGVTMNRAFQKSSSAKEVTAFMDILLRPGHSDGPGFLKEDFQRTDVHVHQGLMAGILADDYLDETVIAQQSRIPIAFVQGAEEQLHNLSYLDGLTLPSIWRGEVIKVPGAGHCVNWEKPEMVNALLKEFVEYCQESGRLS